jgi:hypothetical protein
MQTTSKRGSSPSVDTISGTGVRTIAWSTRTSPVDDTGYYTLVVSDEANRPNNARLDEGVRWLDWGPFLDGQLTYRNLLSSDPLLVRMRRVIDDEIDDPTVQPFIPRAAHCSRTDFEAGGWEACFKAQASIQR